MHIERHNAGLGLTAIGPLVRLTYDANGWITDQTGRRIVAIDCEAGARDPAVAALVSVTARAMHRSGNDQAVVLHVVPDPNRQLSEESIQIHGLTSDRLRSLGAVSAAQALTTLAQVLPVLGGNRPPVLVGHCVAYDRDVLQSSAADGGCILPVAAWIDTYPTTKILRDMAGPAEQGARNTLETFVRLTTGVSAVRGVHSATDDVALLASGLRALAVLEAQLAEPQSR